MIKACQIGSWFSFKKLNCHRHVHIAYCANTNNTICDSKHPLNCVLVPRVRQVAIRSLILKIEPMVISKKFDLM